MMHPDYLLLYVQFNAYALEQFVLKISVQRLPLNVMQNISVVQDLKYICMIYRQQNNAVSSEMFNALSSTSHS